MAGDEARRLLEKLKREGEAAGYLLNPDVDFVLDLMEGLITNEKRYGYWACPCRLAEGERDKDMDIICPCDYRDADLLEHGACLCALYVSRDVAEGGRALKPVPERRGEESPGKKPGKEAVFTGVQIPVWRCRVCGYLCARDLPPLKCPVCKADQDRFERFS